MIEFNKCRTKFLRKKSRFQVTTKLSKQTPSIILNDEVIDSNNGLLQKCYIPIKRGRSSSHFSLYNEHGGQIKRNNPGLSNIYVKGFGYNPFGIFQTQFRLFWENQKKSHIIDTNSINEKPINSSFDRGNLNIKADKFDSIMIKLDSIDPLLFKLAYTNPAELFYRLNIFLTD